MSGSLERLDVSCLTYEDEGVTWGNIYARVNSSDCLYGGARFRKMTFNHGRSERIRREAKSNVLSLTRPTMAPPFISALLPLQFAYFKGSGERHRFLRARKSRPSGGEIIVIYTE